MTAVLWVSKERLRGALWSVLEEEDVSDPLAAAVWARLEALDVQDRTVDGIRPHRLLTPEEDEAARRIAESTPPISREELERQGLLPPGSSGLPPGFPTPAIPGERRAEILGRYREEQA
jgi:hypothetical protein